MFQTGKTLCILLQYEWKLRNIEVGSYPLFILSNEIKYREKDSFRTGLRNPRELRSRSSRTLFFITINLIRFGLEAIGVTFTTERDDSKVVEMEIKTISGKEDDKNRAIQLFTAPLDHELSQLDWSFNYNFNFTIYLTSNVESYLALQIDDLLSQQIWSSAVNQDSTDFQLITRDGNSFPVHKFMLAARSTTFEALFNSNFQQAANLRRSNQVMSWIVR